MINWWFAGVMLAVLILVLLIGPRFSLSYFRRALIAALLVVAALQPNLQESGSGSAGTGPDILLVIDRTTSMGATDYLDGKPRVAGVAQDIAALVSATPGARYSVVVQDNQARIAVPWTADGAAVVTLASTIGWRENAYGSGSDIGVGVPLLGEVLTESIETRPEASRYVAYFGDGEQTRQSQPTSFEGIRPQLAGALVLGYGTVEGAGMTVSPESEDLVMYDGIPAQSMLDEDNLRTIAVELGGEYRNRNSGGDLAWDIGDSAGQQDGSDPPVVTPIGWWAALALIPLAGWELWLSARNFARSRKET